MNTENYKKGGKLAEKTTEKKIDEKKINEKKIDEKEIEENNYEKKDESKVLFTITSSNIWKIISILLFIALVLVIYNNSNKNNNEQTQEELRIVEAEETAEGETNEEETDEDLEASDISVATDDDAVLGNQDAPITIVTFSDYQCPFCSNFFLGIMSPLEENYITTGYVKYAVRDFPLSFHEYAQQAAEAVECAGEQGKFWEYHETIFLNQDNLDIASLQQYAVSLGLDADTFNECLETHSMLPEIQKDMQDGLAYGVRGTPTTFINNKAVSGACPFSVFDKAINAEINGEEWTIVNCQFIES